jgi:hypothetical protein
VEVVARNYATESSNRIHSDEVASQYGFSGGLVPGVADYAYMTQPVVQALGREWLASGFMTAKFLKPVYDGETVAVCARVAVAEPLQVDIELRTKGVICAVGTAGLARRFPVPSLPDYPSRPLPGSAERWPAGEGSPPAGAVLGALEFRLDVAELSCSCPEKFCDPLAIYRGPDAACHPAFFLEQANHILVQNVDLGPWIHTESEVQNYALPRDGEALSLRGKVVRSFRKRNHDLAALDLGLFAEGVRPILRILHTAIIRLRLG